MHAQSRTLLAACCLALLASPSVANDRIPWVGKLEEAHRLAAENGRLVLIHFWDFNCPPCELLERRVFTRPEVIRAVATNYVPVKINVSQARQLAAKYEIDRWPVDVVLDSQGKVLFRGVSSQDPNRYVATLDQVAAHVRIGRPVPPPTPMNTPQEPPAHFSRASAFRPQMQTNPDVISGGYKPVHTAPHQQAAARPPAVPQVNRYADSQYAGRWPATRPQTAPVAPRYSGQFEAPLNHPNAPAPNLDGPQIDARYNPANVAQNPAGNVVQNPAANFIQNPAGNVIQNPAIQNQAANAVTPPSTQPPQGTISPTTAPQQTGNPPLGLEGFCPVTLIEQHRWQRGDAAFGAIHRGRTYIFASGEHQRRFLANPDRFAPALSGYDVVRFSQSGQMIDGYRKHGVFYRNQVFLFTDEGSLQTFWSNPDQFTRIVAQMSPPIDAPQRRP